MMSYDELTNYLQDKPRLHSGMDEGAGLQTSSFRGDDLRVFEHFQRGDGEKCVGR